VPNHLEFLLAVDEFLSENGQESVRQGHELYGISHRAGLTFGPADQSAARWTGQLIHLDYMVWGLQTPVTGGPCRLASCGPQMN
jgi:hypothetical protein